MATALAGAVGVGGSAVGLADSDHLVKAGQAVAAACSSCIAAVQRGGGHTSRSSSCGALFPQRYLHKRANLFSKPPFGGEHDSVCRFNISRRSSLLQGFDHWDGSDGQKDASVLLKLVQEIEPLDTNLIMKEASADIEDAMKRTISGMLGLIPTEQFHITIEARREHLARLLVSSMMTGYTLRNAEYRLLLQRSFQLGDAFKREPLPSDVDLQDSSKLSRSVDAIDNQTAAFNADLATSSKDIKALIRAEPDDLGMLSPEAQNYILLLEAKLRGTTEELQDYKKTNAALKMESITGDEQNDLLDYLRSLEPDQVTEMSQPSSEAGNVVQIVIKEVLGTLFPNQSSSSCGIVGGMGIGSLWELNDGSESLSNVPLQFQSTVTVKRDYLARLLFWCMLLGHHMREVEYRLELCRALSLSSDM